MKKIISLLLVLSMLLVVFASCGNNNGDESSSDVSSETTTSTDSGDTTTGQNPTDTPDDDDQLAAAKKAAFKALASDLEAAAKKFASGSKFTIKITSNVEIPMGEETTTVKVVATVVKDGNNFRIYGDLADIAALLMPQDSENDEESANLDETLPEIDTTFDFTYLGETLYISIPMIGANIYIDDLAVEDIEELVGVIIAKLEEYDVDVDGMMEEASYIATNVIGVIKDGVLLEALEKLNFAECESFEDVLTKAMNAILPVVGYIQNGKDWEDMFKESEDGMTLDDFIQNQVNDMLEDIPPYVLVILNTDDVMNFLKGDLSKYVDITITENEGVTTYTLTVKKELFEDVVKIAQKFASIVDENMVIESDIDDIVLTVSVDGDKNLTGISLKVKINISVGDMFAAAGNVDFDIAVSANAEDINAPDTTDFIKVDKEELPEIIEEIIDGMFREEDTGFGEGYNVFDGWTFENVGLSMSWNDEDEAKLEEMGFDSMDEYQNYLKGVYAYFNFNDIEEYYDGEGNIFVDDELFAYFDGNCLYMTVVTDDALNIAITLQYVLIY